MTSPLVGVGVAPGARVECVCRAGVRQNYGLVYEAAVFGNGVFIGGTHEYEYPRAVTPRTCVFYQEVNGVLSDVGVD